jgi:Amt family ammonium transporter
LTANLIGAVAVIATSVIGTFVVYKLVDAIFGMRVSPSEESTGLDHSQHGETINSNLTKIS